MRTDIDILNSIPKSNRLIFKKSNKENEISKILDSIGGNKEASKWFEASSENISIWRSRGKIPDARIRVLELKLIREQIIQP